MADSAASPVPPPAIRSVSDLPEWSTRKQVSEATQFAAQTLARWAVEGRGPKVTKVGGRVRYFRDDVAEFMQAQRAASNPSGLRPAS